MALFSKRNIAVFLDELILSGDGHSRRGSKTSHIR